MNTSLNCGLSWSSLVLLFGLLFTLTTMVESRSVPAGEERLSEIKNLIESNPIVVFVREGCPYCINAEKLLKSNNIPYKVITFSGPADDEYKAEVKKFSGHNTVPIIYIKNKLIGGYTELEACKKKGGLDEFMQKK